MRIGIRYFTKSGNTEKVAKSIEKIAGVEALSIDSPITEEVDIIFLGGSVYAFGLDDALKAFIANLDSKLVKSAALFSTSAIVKSGNRDMEKCLNEKGIKVLQPAFYCRGEFKIMHKGHPNTVDLKEAAIFAEKILHGGK